MMKTSESTLAKTFNSVRMVLKKRLRSYKQTKMIRILREAFIDIHLPTKSSRILMPTLKIMVDEKTTFSYPTAEDSSYGSRHRLYEQRDMASIFQKCVNQMKAIRRCLCYEDVRLTVMNPLMVGILEGLRQEMGFKCKTMSADIQMLWQCTEVIHDFLGVTLTKSDAQRRLMKIMSQNKMCSRLMGKSAKDIMRRRYVLTTRSY